MKLLTTVVPLAAITTAFVIPDEQVMQQIAFEGRPQPSYLEQWKESVTHVWEEVEAVFEQTVAKGGSLIDDAIDTATKASKDVAHKFECTHSMTAFDAQAWIDSAKETANYGELDTVVDQLLEHRPRRGHHGHHGHHCYRGSKLTVYQLISQSKYTTKFAKLIDEFPLVVELLNSTSQNFTVFAPTDAAFEKIPYHGKKPSKDVLVRLLAYHLIPEVYPAGRVLLSHTLPTNFKEDFLGGEAQRLRVGLGWGGLKVNFFSKIVAADIFGSNGVIHGIDTLLLPPPPAAKILEILPGQFSTLDYALGKTSLAKELGELSYAGSTIFAPTNWAFQKLGPGINAFLFSSYGEKYLKALLQYHIVANNTLYSDAFYSHPAGSSKAGCNQNVNKEGIPQGRLHVDLPTLLEGKSLSIDVARWAAFITIKINGFDTVSIQDGIAKDGVIHVVSSLLIPPKTNGEVDSLDEEMTVEEFKARFDTYVDEL